ncbi:MAG: winged helix-turn-helix domain-containing protein, partial [Actinobacteria bacterium]|nr:winged helix-turn-helix domain-containing protein [Actinomycetota bacterium]
DLVKDGMEGLHFAESVDYDCIILDIMLPTIDGFSILRKLRARKINTPILILTAKDTIKDKVNGLDSGADDYITKPFSFEELIARVRAMLRRKSEEKETVLFISDLTLNLITREVFRGNHSIELTSKEFAILEYFLRNKGRVLTKSQIANHVWNYEFEYKSNIVEVYVRYLRKKLEDNFENKLIHTISGAGYIIKVKK